MDARRQLPQGVHQLPQGVHQLPTMLIDIDSNGSIHPKIEYFDELHGQPVSSQVARIQFVDALLPGSVGVMMLSFRKGHYLHCNAFVVHAGGIERFDPRGNLQGPDQSETVRNLYSPSLVDRFLQEMFLSWCTDGNTVLTLCRTLRKSKNQVTRMLEHRYFPPKEDGIGSNDTRYVNAAHGSDLVFSYIRTRIRHDKHRQIVLLPRDSAHHTWVQNELTRVTRVAIL